MNNKRKFDKKSLLIFVFFVGFLWMSWGYNGYCQDYVIIYTSRNLAGHVVNIEPNPGGGTTCPFSSDDVMLFSYPDYGEVISNAKGRHVWVNAIGTKMFEEELSDGLNIIRATYKYSGRFRLPTLPAPDVNQMENPQAIHTMVQLWDGRNELLCADYHSLEFSLYWDLNPWGQDYGIVKVYSDSATGPDRLVETGIYLEPDTNWHCFEMIVDFKSLQWRSITIDGETRDLSHLDLLRVNHTDWDTDTRVVLNITTESLSAWPHPDCSLVFKWHTHYKDLEFGFFQRDPDNRVINCALDVDPDMLNNRSRGRWVTAYIELPDEYDPGNINVDTVRLHYGNTNIVAVRGNAQDNIFMVKFRRGQVINMLAGLSGCVELKLTGVVEGNRFEGRDTVRFR